MSYPGNRLCLNVKQLDDRALGYVAAYFQALSEPLRLKILNELRNGARNVNDLTTRLSCSQANVSKHLGVLARLGFVARDAQGTAAYYRICDPAVYELCDLVCGRLALQLQDQVEALKSLHVPGLRSASALRQSGKRRPLAPRELPSSGIALGHDEAASGSHEPQRSARRSPKGR